MTAVGPFFPYLGSKHRITAKLPPPRHDLIIEPFAGSAGYACNHPERDVLLVENGPALVALWRWLSAAAPSDILALPLTQYGDVIGQTKETENLPVEAKMLLSLFSIPAPRGCSRVTAFNGWKSEARRTQLARDVTRIRHWKVQLGDYSSAPDVEATWVIDPPYQKVANAQYLGGSHAAISFPALGRWCRARRGQVFVHEGQGADWLPFRPFVEMKATARSAGHMKTLAKAKGTDARKRFEVLWTNEDGT